MEENQPLLGQQQQPVAPNGYPQGSYGAGVPGESGLPSFKGDVPNEDVHENASVNEPTQPSAPPTSAMDRVTGYENIGFQPGELISPPTYAEATAGVPESTSIMHAELSSVSEDDAREALLNDVSSHCCYGKGAARDLVITNATASSAFHYQLETFTEGRKTAWEYEPYNGQVIDGPQNGPAPMAWDIQAHPTTLFQNQCKHFEVPHTASVKVCHNCMGARMNRCWRCKGRGRVICANCDGSGRVLHTVVHHDHHHHGHNHHGHGHHGHGHHGHGHHGHHDVHTDVKQVYCHHCNGTGRKRCRTCSGCGQITCQPCSGRGQLKCYIKLTVTWKTTKADHVVERTSLPDHLVKGAQGKMAFQDEQLRVAPVTNFPDSAVNSASQQLVHSHATAFPTERILMQRHWIRMVPVSEVTCNWKGESFSYWVYGFDNLVHAPDYPQKCCFGCAIL